MLGYFLWHGSLLFDFYPGTSNEDTVIQIMEYFHIPSYIQVSLFREQIYSLRIMHPYLLTLLFSQFIKLGLYLGDVNIGVAVYGILHMTFLCLFLPLRCIICNMLE